MIERLAELNRLLLSIDDLMDPNRTAKIVAVLDSCRSMVIEGRLPDHNSTVIFAKDIGLVNTFDEDIILTDTGTHFLELNPDGLYELSYDQSRFLLRQCFFDGPLRGLTRGILKSFSPSFENDSYRWSTVDGNPIGGSSLVLENLKELGLVKIIEEGLEINLEYMPTVSAFLEEGEGWSEEELQNYLREKAEVGTLAEDLAVKWERNRLETAGHFVEAKCVRRISGVRVNAGYDIESYDKDATHLSFNRYIEVKGTRAKRLCFFWSENEMKTARKLGDKYWIYFMGGIDTQRREASIGPILFQNPIQTVLTDATIKKTPQGIIIEGSIKYV